jgi:ferredoxin-NADP reductase
MHASEQNLEQPYAETLRLVARRDEYEHVSTYVFAPEQPVPFSAGQYAHVRLLNMPEDVRRVHELSFASAPHEPEILFGIDSRSGSDYQLALRALTPGDAVELFKIRGHMTWPPPVPEAVMIAGGVGVTPFRSMLVDARERELPIAATLIQVSSGPSSMPESCRGMCTSTSPSRARSLRRRLRR